jgi:hypothetical protein
VSTPEDAVAQARAEAARLRGTGTYGPAETARTPVPALDEGVPWTKLVEWASIEADLAEVRSTRPYGAPLTALKRGLVRLLVQYNGQLAAQQTRFNLALAARVRQLEKAVAELQAERPRDP